MSLFLIIAYFNYYIIYLIMELKYVVIIMKLTWHHCVEKKSLLFIIVHVMIVSFVFCH